MHQFLIVPGINVDAMTVVLALVNPAKVFLMPSTLFSFLKYSGFEGNQSEDTFAF